MAKKCAGRRLWGPLLRVMRLCRRAAQSPKPMPRSLLMRDFAPKPAPWAARLGYAGLVPFFALALSLRFLPVGTRDIAVFALMAYAATITSFLGAIHWGLAMRATQSTSVAPFAWGVIPSLVAWLALLSSPAVALCVLGALLWVCYAVDRITYPKFQLQNWLPMRLRLTVVASMSCFYVATL